MEICMNYFPAKIEICQGKGIRFSSLDDKKQKVEDNDERGSERKRLRERFIITMHKI